ncbi:MAG: M23 family metallopeptidase [Thermoanaerobaculia bacterium]
MKLTRKTRLESPAKAQGPDQVDSVDRVSLEIQVHRSDLRRGVWYFFLSRRQVSWWIAGGSAFFVYLLFGLTLAPAMVSDLLLRREYDSLMAERTNQGRRVQALVQRLTDLQDETDDLRLRMHRIFLTYGLDIDASAGQGGFPVAPREVPDSIYSADILRGTIIEALLTEKLSALGSFIDEVQAFEAQNSDQTRTTPSVSPLRGKDFVLTSPFGRRRSPFTQQVDFHPGIDLAAPTGTPIYAPGDATVVFAGRYPVRQSVSWWRYGNMVALRNGDQFITLYGHCDEIKVRNGMKVSQGDVIATVGDTGWSTSPHLHYEVRSKNAEGKFEPVDPRIYILDHRWRDEEKMLVSARQAPDLSDYEPLPRVIGR